MKILAKGGRSISIEFFAAVSPKYLHCKGWDFRPAKLIYFIQGSLGWWVGVSKQSRGHLLASCSETWEEAFRAQYAQLHNYNWRFQLLFVQNQLLEINCCRHISVNLALMPSSPRFPERRRRSRTLILEVTKEACQQLNSCFPTALLWEIWMQQPLTTIARFLKTSICLSSHRASIDAKLWILNRTQIQWRNLGLW